jgi:serine/threonine protein kinase
MWQMAGAAPMEAPAALGPGSVLGPGRLGQRYRIRDTLNTTDGTFAEVFSVELDPPPPHSRTYAVKVSREGAGRRRGWEHEVGVMQRVRDADCPHLAAVRDHFADQATGRLCIVMEQYQQSLEGVRRGGPRVTAQVVWGWAEDMARGLAVLHRRDVGIIHTDLELRNVFVDAEGRAVLGDFGTSLFIRAVTSGGVRPSRAAMKLDGDSPACPPEVRRAYTKVAGVARAGAVSTVVEALIDARLSPKADVWALGAVLLQLLLASHMDLAPHHVDRLAALELPARERDLTGSLEMIFGGPDSGVEGVYAGRLAALIARVLTLDPSLRPSAAELLPPPNPDLPHVGSRVVARPALLQRLKRAVLEGGGGAVAVTSQAVNKRKVWGMGGVGKTTLAKLLMGDEDVRARFRDGVAWVVLGNEGPSLTSRQEMVYEQLVGKRPDSPFKDAEQGRQSLRRALAGKACLVVVDDMWEKVHAAAFDCLGPEGVLLVTSRFDNVVSTPPEACVKVDVLQPPDGEAAFAMLRSHAREEGDAAFGEEPEYEARAMRAVLRRCGGSPLAIAIAGSLKRRPGMYWYRVCAEMERDRSGALAMVKSSDEYPKGLREALGASVAHLKATSQQEYECLLWYGAFLEDTWVPLEIVRRVWGLKAFYAEGVLLSLAGRSLIELDVEGGWRSQAHDLLRDFLQAEAREAVGEEGVRGMHGAIVTQGIQACEDARVFDDEFGTLVPYFRCEGVFRHHKESGKGTVSRCCAKPTAAAGVRHRA